MHKFTSGWVDPTGWSSEKFYANREYFYIEKKSHNDEWEAFYKWDRPMRSIGTFKTKEEAQHFCDEIY